MWGKEKAAQRQRQLAASSEDTSITTNGASEVVVQLLIGNTEDLLLSTAEHK